ncbi:50S ribosomal protein L25 [Engelhardtia mirabilis]|uniref:Large ribosomal subunit protein bL25 n=1 Tax=Engelhardtia mirabilis TaxID=2528011 RepID=A0A518BPI4_9BACT|nr:50S ribosomal protein L25 [Planctomycetes bacterium Pla133]QDV03221.1 50S ribosomal protein L25 [Planctomycetes bacterium Pla86]
MSNTLKGQVRERLGSRHCRQLRQQGLLPISVQGGGKPNADLSVSLDEFQAARRHHERMFDIEVAGGTNETAVVREIQWDSLGENLIHVELQRVTRGVEMEAEIDVTFVNQFRGGVLNVTHSTIMVRSIPSLLPDVLEVRADLLEIEHFLFARDLKLPEGVSLASDPDQEIAVVVGAEGEEADAEGAEEDEDAASVPKVGEKPKPSDD